MTFYLTRVKYCPDRPFPEYASKNTEFTFCLKFDLILQIYYASNIQGQCMAPVNEKHARRPITVGMPGTELTRM